MKKKLNRKNIFIVAGEISGDLYGYHLAKALKSGAADIKIFAVGGEKLKKSADVFLADIAAKHKISLWDQFWVAKDIKNCILEIENILKTEQIDVAVIIDFTPYNFLLAKVFEKNNIPIITFITPNFWIWKNSKKAKKLINYSEKIVCIFPQEYEFYKNFTDKVFYFGHPLGEIIKAKKREKQGEDNKTIAIFPGSRKQEIKQIFPIILKTVKRLKAEKRDLKFILALSSLKFEKLINKYLKFHKVDFVGIESKGSDEVFAKADLVISVTGTTSLEAMFYRRPIIVLGALGPITYFICTKILKLDIKFAALPNIVAKQILVPEFVQQGLRPEKIAAKALELLRPGVEAEWQFKFDLIYQMLRKEDRPFEKIAEAVIGNGEWRKDREMK